MSTFVRASHVPLFDRLFGKDPSPPRARLLAQDQLRESLRRDLLRLFNSRNGQTIEQFLASEASVLNYGLPDWVGLCAGSETDMQRLAQVVAHGIALYEPRLSAVSVTARPDPLFPGHAWLTLSGSVVIDRVLQRVDFEIALDETVPVPQACA